MEFTEWLEREKAYSEKAARDVVSRIKRIKRIANRKHLKYVNLTNLEEKGEFKGLSMSVKSQLRRAYKLYCEYSETNT